MSAKKWFRKIWAQYGPKRRLIIVGGDTPPSVLATRHLYLARDDGENWTVAMLCPCNCGDRLELMLIPEARPNWTLESRDTQPPTLHPSIWRKTACGAHFWIKNGRVIWH